MSSTIRVRARVQGGTTEVQALIRHPMDSGFVKDASGKPIPAHHIETLVFKHGERTVLTADWGPAVAKDPYIKFAFAGGAKGGTLTITWIDNLGETDTLAATLA